MKIGYVLSTFPKLSETFVLNEIVELITKGHEVTIFSLHYPIDTISHTEVSHYDLLKDVHYFTKSRSKITKIHIGLKSSGLFGWNYPTETIRGKIFSIAAAKHFSKIAKKLSLQVIHAHFNGSPTQTAMLIAEKVGIPFTFTGHAFDIFVNPITNVLKNRMENAYAVITPSFFNREYLHRLTGVTKDKIHVVRPCLNIDKFEIIKRNPEAFTILSVGRLVEKKGLTYSIQSVKELLKAFPESKYRIIGAGPLEDKLKKLVQHLNLTKNIKFLGAVDDDHLLKELSKATVFTLPCIKADNGDIDGIPVTLQEAMVSKIPVISTKISGIPELIEDKKEGLLVKPKNIDQLKNAIKVIFNDKSLQKFLGENGRQKIYADFNIHNEIRKLISIWEEAT